MLKRFLLTFAVALTMTVAVAGTVSAAPAQVTATAPTSCAQSVQNVSGGAGSGPTQAGFEVDFTATCAGHMLVAWQAIDSAGHVAWKSDDHHFSVSSTTVNIATATWLFGKTPAGTYNVYITLASQNDKAVYFHALWSWFVVPSASAASTTSAAGPNTQTACAQSLTPVTGWGSGTATWASFGIGFTAACPGHVLVEWQVIDATGKVAWKSADHHYLVSTTLENDASMTWYFGSTPAGTYNVYVTLASQNGKDVYFHGLWGQPVVS